MDYQDKTREELIAVLLELEQENRNLKLFCEKNKSVNQLLPVNDEQAQIDFRASKKHFELVFNVSPDAAIISRLSDGKILEVNETFTKVTGYSREEALNSSSLNLKLWHNPENRKNLVNNLLKNGFCENLEAEFVRKNGSSLLGLISAKVFEIDSVPHIISTIRDNTKFRQTEETLRKSEIELQKNYAVLNSIFESSQNVIIFSLDSNYCYMAFTNSHKQTMKQIWGVDIEIGINMLDQISNPDDRHKAKTNFDRVLKGEHLRFEEEYGDSKRHRAYYENIYNPIIDSRGVVLGLSVFVIDITDRKATEEELRINEERYRLLAENARDVIWTMKLDGTITYISPSVELMRGLTVEEAMHQSLEQILTPDSQIVSIDYAQRLYTAFEAGLPLPTFRGELEYYRKDGSTVWTEALTYPIPGNDGISLTMLGLTRDITERKQAEEALKQSEEKFRALYNHMTDGSALHTLVFNDQGDPVDYLINEVNPAFETLLGISRESVVNKTSREAYGVDFPPYFNLYSKVALNGNPEVFETYFAPLNKYFSISVYSPYKNSFATIFENITERKEAENENERIQKLLEDSQRIGKIGGWEVNMDTMELKWTKEMYHIHELDLTYKPTVDQRANFYTPESLPVIDKAFQNAIEQSGSYEVDSEIITAKGNRRSVKSIAKVDHENRRVIGLFQDITERKQAEKALKESELRFRNNMEHVNLISVMLDTNGDITFANNYFLQLTGWQREEILGQNWFEIFIPAEIELRQILFPEKNKGTVPPNYENEILTRTGERRLIEWSNTLLYDSLGNKAGIAGIGVDITDRKHAEAKLKTINEQLKELNATKDKFFSIIAHDLKAPFNGILGFSELLKDEARNLDIGLIESYANNINSTAKQTFKLLENLLDWARMQQSSLSFEPKPISFNHFLKNEIEDLKYYADQKNITLANGVAKEITFDSDEKMLGSVLRNLMSNAIKFTQKGGTVSIEAQMKVDNVEVSISDTGVGMDKETLKKLFKIETSFSSRGTENEKGTGLGLLLCKEFVEKHGGTIWVESEKGKGSKFTFSIPLTTKIQ